MQAVGASATADDEGPGQDALRIRAPDHRLQAAPGPAGRRRTRSSRRSSSRPARATSTRSAGCPTRSRCHDDRSSASAHAAHPAAAGATPWIRSSRAQRDRLTERFAVMQSELGGLFYEMAIRDHVRMEVLMQKAAELQRVDAELGQLERLLESGPGGDRRQLRRLWRGLRPRRGVLRAVREPADGDMIAALRAVRLSRAALAVVAALSGLATALVIATALGRTDAQSAAIAALRHRPVVIIAVAGPSRHAQPAVAAAADPSPAPRPAPSRRRLEHRLPAQSAHRRRQLAGRRDRARRPTSSTTTTTTTHHVHHPDGRPAQGRARVRDRALDDELRGGIRAAVGRPLPQRHAAPERNLPRRLRDARAAPSCPTTSR